MELSSLLKEAVVAGRLAEPFSAVEAAVALSHPEWSPARVQSYLIRHCLGNLAAASIDVERVAHGRYRLTGPAGRL